MKIAVTYENGNVFQHFGHTEAFKIYEVQDKKITGSEVVETAGSGHGALAGFLSERNVDVLICGGIGGGAKMALAQAGIKLFGGVSGSTDDAVKAYIAGNLSFDPDAVCNHHNEHHGHGEGHSCGSHGHSHSCGGGSCGNH
ncbi:MAG: NifB/NifX family molybdenum-iron cluster-binding protein [Anaerovoracaceae bacterium]|nr:NifB/NifX family molybdenum-iron cluster-binding protein [Anaerovoracaceae bacterium]